MCWNICDFFKPIAIGQMDNQRIKMRAPFCFENLRYCDRIERVSREAVHCFRGQADDFARAQKRYYFCALTGGSDFCSLRHRQQRAPRRFAFSGTLPVSATLSESARMLTAAALRFCAGRSNCEGADGNASRHLRDRKANRVPAALSIESARRARAKPRAQRSLPARCAAPPAPAIITGRRDRRLFEQSQRFFRVAMRRKNFSVR